MRVLNRRGRWNHGLPYLLACLAIIAIDSSRAWAQCPAELEAQELRAQAVKEDGLKVYQTPYYTIYTDLDPDQVREASLRMTRMAEEYHARTAGFSGQITSRLPFFLFKTDAEYHAAGGLPRSVGEFTGAALMASADPSHAERTWQIVQHEGFHQFAAAVIGGELPVWANEGVAEYFGEAQFTGDGFVIGLIPPARLQRLRGEIEGPDARSIKTMMLMGPEQWTADLQKINYDQAWSMVHFLINADGGKYQSGFVNFMFQIGQGQNWQQAWAHNFSNTAAFETEWKSWWVGQSDDPTANLSIQATCQTLTSYLARASARHQAFDSFADFLHAAQTDQLKVPGPDEPDWLPPSLLTNAVAAVAKENVTWSLLPPDPTHHIRNQRIAAELPDQTRIVGNYAPKGLHGWSVWCEVDDLVPVMNQAKELQTQGKKDSARQLLVSALRRDSTSPSAVDAKEMIASLR
jgi:Protein of unknown function (DUF1570)